MSDGINRISVIFRMTKCKSLYCIEWCRG